jgi:hypothetical protein
MISAAAKVSFIAAPVCCLLNKLASVGHIAVIACDKREAFAQGSEATKQSTLSLRGEMDCFAEPVIGRAFARPVGSR